LELGKGNGKERENYKNFLSFVWFIEKEERV